MGEGKQRSTLRRKRAHGLYGEEANLRGTQILNLVVQITTPHQEAEEVDSLREFLEKVLNRMIEPKLRLLEETQQRRKSRQAGASPRDGASGSPGERLRDVI